RGVTVVLATLVVVVRLFRFGDGVTRRYFNRPFSLALDLPVSGELVRLLNSTVSRPLLLVGTAAAVAILVGMGALTVWSLRQAERYFATPAHRRLFAASVAGLVAISALLPRDRAGGLRTGAFGA